MRMYGYPEQDLILSQLGVIHGSVVDKLDHGFALCADQMAPSTEMCTHPFEWHLVKIA